MRFTFCIVLIIAIAVGGIVCKAARDMNAAAGRSLAGIEAAERAGNAQLLREQNARRNFIEQDQRRERDRRFAELLGK